MHLMERIQPYLWRKIMVNHKSSFVLKSAGIPVLLFLLGSLVLLSGCTNSGSSPTPQIKVSPTPSPEITMTPTVQLIPYRNETYGFEFQVPPEAVISQTDSGTRIDLPTVPGTTLSEKYLEVQVTSPSPEVCSSPQNIGRDPAVIQVQLTTLNGLEFRKENSGGVATGNIYEFTAYNTVYNGNCVSLTFTLHYTDPANYVSPPPEFDRAAEIAIFPQIMATFR
jgi:hypothetical protein